MGGGGGGIQFYQSGYKLGPGSAAARWGAAVIFNFTQNQNLLSAKNVSRGEELG